MHSSEGLSIPTVQLKSSPLAQKHIQYIHTADPVNHLRSGNRPGKPQRESCWQEAAALHLSLKVSENTMRLSSALDSTFTSLHISFYALTHHWSCPVVSFSPTFLSRINLHALLHYCIPTYTALRGLSAKVCHGSPLTLSPEAGEWKHIF